MDDSKGITEASLSEIVKLISNILKENKRIYLVILALVIIGSAGVLVKEKLDPVYHAKILIGSEALNLPNLKIIIEDINLEIERSDPLERFDQNGDVYENVDQLIFGEFKISPADDKDNSLKAYRLEFDFSDPVDSLNFENVSSLILSDIKNKASVNVLIQEIKKELLGNIKAIDISITNATETEIAIRQSIISNNKDLGMLGIAEYYTNLNKLMSAKNNLEKKLFFYEKENLVYKLTNYSFENQAKSKIELLAYTIFLFLFFSLMFTIFKLILE
tara:strand:+ start:116 stop:940 length:825 start_codon:yes stop_codon:yes gene_type:complete